MNKNQAKNNSRLSNYKIQNNKQRNSNEVNDWKTQTYQKIQDANEGFEPITEYPKGEAYGTVSHKRGNRKKKNFSKFYNNEMNFVEAKLQNIAYSLAKKEDEEVIKYQNMRESNHLMSSGSRKILQNRYKESVVKNNPDKSIKISKLFDTPVHQRLFVDNENRKKRIEEMSQEEGRLINVSHSRKVLDLTSKMSFTKSGMNSYRSHENLNSGNPNVNNKVSNSLRKALDNQNEYDPSRRAAIKSKREKMAS